MKGWWGVFCALVAVLLGVLYSGVLVSSGSLAWIDEWDPRGRGLRWRGETPWLVPQPWLFTAEDIPRLDDKVIVVTGANSGIGYWTASHLAGHGATVILGCRSSVKCGAAAADMVTSSGSHESKVVPMTLDLASFDSINLFVANVLRSFGRLDSLVRAPTQSLPASKPAFLDSFIPSYLRGHLQVLNAGVMLQPWNITESGLEHHFAVNHIGHHLLTKLLLPLLERTASVHGEATVSVLSSAIMYDISHPDGIDPSYLRRHQAGEAAPAWFDPLEAYAQSKLANVLFAQELAERELAEGHNVLVNAHAPGMVATNLLNHILGPGGSVERAAGPLGPFLRQALMWHLSQIAWHPREASLTQVFTAVSPQIIDSKTSGKYFQSVAREQTPDPHCRNERLQSMLWERSESLIEEIVTLGEVQEDRDQRRKKEAASGGF